MDRLARNLADLLKLVEDLTGKGVKVRFCKESLTFTGEDSPMATLILSIIGAVASFERSMTLERQREGIALAKVKGVYKGGKPKLSPGQVAQIVERSKAGEKKATLATPTSGPRSESPQKETRGRNRKNPARVLGGVHGFL